MVRAGVRSTSDWRPTPDSRRLVIAVLNWSPATRAAGMGWRRWRPQLGERSLLVATLASLLAMAGHAWLAHNTQPRHHHHPQSVEYVSTLPDVRADTVSDEDIAAHEAARAEAAKVLKNP